MPTLIKEDGTGLANANSYANRADYLDYHATRQHGGDGEEDAEAIDATLIEATRHVDLGFPFPSVPTSTTQALRCPQVALRDMHGRLVLSTSVPTSVVQGTCEQAYQLRLKDRLAALDDKGVVAVAGGKTSKSFVYRFADILHPAAYALMAHMAAPNRVVPC